MFVAHPHEKTGTHFCACHKSVLDKTSFSEGSDEGPNKRKTEMASAESQAAQNAAPPGVLVSAQGTFYRETSRDRQLPRALPWVLHVPTFYQTWKSAPAEHSTRSAKMMEGDGTLQV
jgi:hypothetical protein